MKKLIAIVLAALMMFTLMAPVSVAANENAGVSVVADVGDSANFISLFVSGIRNFIHKIVGTICQLFRAECPFCDGTHLPNAPVAKITALEEKPVVYLSDKDVTLDAAYAFEATENEASATYANWHADFVITANRDVKNVVLAGQYDSYGPDYLGFELETIESGDEIRLIETYAKEFTSEKITVNYDEICSIIKTFNCGIASLDRANFGATITVELRLYETKAPTADNNTTNDETGRWMTVAAVDYTII